MVLKDGRLLPLVFREELWYRGRRVVKEYRFDYENGLMEYWRATDNQKSGKRWEVPLKEPIYDLLSLLYNFRIGAFGPLTGGQTLRVKTIPTPAPEELIINLGPETDQGRKVMLTVREKSGNERGPFFIYVGPPMGAADGLDQGAGVRQAYRPVAGSRRHNAAGPTAAGRAAASGQAGIEVRQTVSPVRPLNRKPRPAAGTAPAVPGRARRRGRLWGLALFTLALLSPAGTAAGETWLEDLHFSVDVLMMRDAVRARLTFQDLGDGKYRAEISGELQGALKALGGERRDQYRTDMAWRHGRLLPLVYREESRRREKAPSEGIPVRLRPGQTGDVAGKGRENGAQVGDSPDRGHIRSLKRLLQLPPGTAGPHPGRPGIQSGRHSVSQARRDGSAHRSGDPPGPEGDDIRNRPGSQE